MWVTAAGSNMDVTIPHVTLDGNVHSCCMMIQYVGSCPCGEAAQSTPVPEPSESSDSKAGSCTLLSEPRTRRAGERARPLARLPLEDIAAGGAPASVACHRGRRPSGVPGSSSWLSPAGRSVVGGSGWLVAGRRAPIGPILSHCIVADRRAVRGSGAFYY